MSCVFDTVGMPGNPDTSARVGVLVGPGAVDDFVDDGLADDGPACADRDGAALGAWAVHPANTVARQAKAAVRRTANPPMGM